MQTENWIRLPIAIVSLLLLVVGVSGAWYVHQLQAKSSQILSVNVASIIAAEELELQVRAMRYQLSQFLYQGEAAYLRAAADLREQVEKYRRDAEEYATTEREKRIVAEINSGLNAFFTELAKLVAQPSSSIDKEQVRNLSTRVLTDRVIRNARRYLDQNEADLKQSNRQNQAAADRLALALLLLGTCGAVSGLVAGYGVARNVSRSIFQLSIPIRDVAGKLDEVVGPISVSADPGLEDLETVLKSVSANVESVIEKLHTSHREMIRSEQLAAVGQLAAGLAHELRNPLMCMKMLVQSSRRGRSGPLEDRDLEVLEEEIGRLESRLQEFLDFARPAKLHKRPADLRPLVAQTVRLLSPRAERRNIQLQERFQDDPLMLECDALQVRQVVLNLLMNSVDAVPHGGKIDVRVYHEHAEAGNVLRRRYVALEVMDDGHGLPIEDASRVFEPFFSTKETGLGLGLAICRRIVESHGGEISARDRPGGGTVVQVRLPVASPAIQDALLATTETPVNVP